MKEQCICVKLSFRLWKTESEIHKILTGAFGDNAVVKTWSFECLSQFRCGEMLLEDCEYSQVTQTKIWRMFTKSLTETSESTVLEFPARLGLLCDMYQKILVEDLGVWQMSVQFVPRLFSNRWSSNFWSLEMWLWSYNVLTCLIWPLVTFSCFGEWNCNYGSIISRMFWNIGTFMYHPTYSSKKLPAVTEMLDVLYKLRRRLLWRELHDSCKFSVHFLSTQSRSFCI
jgi:hypothetical protein